MNSELDSIQALKDCMDFLGLAPDLIEQPFLCKVVEVDGKYFGGTSRGRFRVDLHKHDGPFIEFDQTIRGYGLKHDQFKPRYQSFEFVREERAGLLTIQNRPPSLPPYHFVVEFKAT